MRGKIYIANGTNYIYDPDLEMVINVIPRFENWFLMAKPNTTFFNDRWDFFQELLDLGGKEAMDKKVED